MGDSILSIGASAIAAAQAGLTTTGHNISNVNTPGYNRQEAVQTSRPAMYTGSGFLGQGVDVTTVRRIYSDFLAARGVSAQTQSSALNARQDQLTQLDNLFGDPTSGLTPSLDAFFAGINAVASNPGDMSARQTALSAGQGLVSRFQQIQSQVAEMRDSANSRIAGTVSTINNLGAEIATLNARIVAGGYGVSITPPNDLMDQRDQLLLELNKSVGATAVAQSDGTYNVFLSNGQALVVGTQAQPMTVQPDPQDPQNLAIGTKSGSSVTLFHSADFTGGELQGLLAFRDNDLADAENALGQISVALGSAFNAQHRLGLDLNGTPGGDFFKVPTPNVQASLGNTGNAVVQATIADGTKVTASDYRLDYDGANYTLTRLADGTTQTFAALPQTVDGLQIAVSSGAAQAGDTFLIQPTRYAARDISLAIGSPAQIAAAAPIRTSATPANGGNAVISQGSVDAGYASAPLAGPVTIAYSTATGMLTGFPAGSPVTRRYR